MLKGITTHTYITRHQKLMHDLAEVTPARSIAHHDDTIPTRQDVLGDGEFRPSAVQLASLVE